MFRSKLWSQGRSERLLFLFLFLFFLRLHLKLGDVSAQPRDRQQGWKNQHNHEVCQAEIYIYIYICNERSSKSELLTLRTSSINHPALPYKIKHISENHLLFHYYYYYYCYSFQNMPREISLIIYHELTAIPAHWSLLIPHKAGDTKGKVIHAIGTPFTGYNLEIKEYDVSKTKKKNTRWFRLDALMSVGCPILTPRPRGSRLRALARSRWIRLE